MRFMSILANLAIDRSPTISVFSDMRRGLVLSCFWTLTKQNETTTQQIKNDEQKDNDGRKSTNAERLIEKDKRPPIVQP